MQLQKKFITSHIIPVLSGGDVNYRLPDTMRDVYAFRVRYITSVTFIAPPPATLIITSKQLVSGYRWGSSYGTKNYPVAVFPLTTLGNFPPHKQKKIYLSTDLELNQLAFTFQDELGNYVRINALGGGSMCIDFFHRNKHQY